MIYALLYLIFIVFLAMDMLSARKLFANTSPGLAGLGLLVGVTLVSALTVFAFSLRWVPVGAYYPVPWLLLVFIPGYMCAKWLTGKYESQGTAETERLESVCVRVGWVALFGAALLLINLAFIWMDAGVRS